MGFFSKLTEKKTCGICGKELGLLGKTKLADGYLCKDCAGKLSPFFEGARKATVEDISEQLGYREANKDLVAAFSPTRELGSTWRVLVDDAQGQVIVTNQRDWKSANPDVIAFGDITGCDVSIDEDRREIYREDEDGKRQSFDPPRYESDYDFWVAIRVRHPYFDMIRFKVNDWSVEDRYSAEYDRCQREAYEISGVLNALNAVARQTAQQGGQQQAGGQPQQGEPSQAQPTPSQQQPQPQPAAQAQAPAFCPNCGAATTPGARFCEFCGSALA